MASAIASRVVVLSFTILGTESTATAAQLPPDAISVAAPDHHRPVAAGAEGIGCVGAIYDNGAPNGTNGFSNATDGVFGEMSRRTILDDFMVPPGEAWRVEGLRWRHIWNTLPAGSGTGAEISLRSDAGGQPGNVLVVVDVTGYEENGTGNIYFSRPEAESFASFAPIEFPAGQYWFETNIVGPENNFWLTADVRNSEAWVNYEDLNGLQSSTQQFGAPSDVAWCLTGGRVLYVPGSYATIQSAIYAATDGDVVEVAPGAYAENFDTIGKAIIVRSAGGAATTILTGIPGDDLPIATVNSGEGPDTVIEGFTFNNPEGTTFFAAGMDIAGADPTVRNCDFFDCRTNDRGGALQIFSGSPRFEGCDFVHNIARLTCDAQGGAVYMDGGAAEFVSCLFDDNWAAGGLCEGTVRSYGGAVYIASGSPAFFSCDFTGNLADAETVNAARAFGGAVASYGENVLFQDCTFDANVCAPTGGDDRFGGGGAIIVGSGFTDVTSCVFITNEASGDGPVGAGAGGAFLAATGGEAIVYDCTFAGNLCLGGDGPYIGAGGGVHLQGDGLSTVQACTFIGNTAERGGGVFVFDGTTAGLLDCSFNGNIAELDGTAVWNDGRIFASGTLDGTDELGNNGDLWIGLGTEVYDTLVIDMPYGDIVGATGNIVFEIQGPTPGVEHDQIVVTNPWSLSGGVVAFFDPPLDPGVGSSFQVVSGPAEGRFHVGLLPSLGQDRFARLVYGKGAQGGSVSIAVESLAGLLGFDDPETVGLDGQPRDVALGDFDGINGVDVAIAVPSESGDGSVVVLRNAGTDGGGAWLGFLGATQTTVGADPSSLTTGRYDDDGLLDLAVTNRGDDTMSVLINNGLGNGTFDTPIVFPTQVGPVAIVAGDFTGDGVTDLAVAAAGAPALDGSATGTLTIYGNDGTGMFDVSTTVGGIAAPLNVETGDLDNDKDLDFAVPITSGVEAIFFEKGKPVAQHTLPTGDGPSDIATSYDGGEIDLFADLDGNGLPDLVTANTADETISIMINAGGGAFETTVSLPVGDNPRSVTALDVDADGDVDIALIADDEDLMLPVVQILRSSFAESGEVSFASVETVDAGEEPAFVRAADLDGDGVADLLTVNDGGGAADGLVGSANAFLNFSSVCVADISGNGAVDFADVLAILGAWGNPGGPEDLSGNGVVDFADLLIVLGAWGVCN